MDRTKTISVISLDEILSVFPKDSPDIDFFNELLAIGRNLSESSNYVYKVSLQFGDEIISKGHMPFDNFSVAQNKYGKSLADFKSDLSYSTDPLGIVLTNYIEIYTINRNSKRES